MSDFESSLSEDNLIEDIPQATEELDNTEEVEQLEVAESEPEVIDSVDSPDVNCLYLTVKKDYSIVVIKNKIKRALKGSWKIAVSIFVLNFLATFL